MSAVARRRNPAGLAIVSIAVSFALLGCGTSSATSGSPRPTLPTVTQAGVAYLAFVQAWDTEINPANASYDAAGSDPQKLGAANAAFASLEQEYVDWLASHPWPAEVQPLVDQTLTDARKEVALDRELVTDPLNTSIQSQADALAQTLSADGAKLREALGLPPLDVNAFPTFLVSPSP